MADRIVIVQRGAKGFSAAQLVGVDDEAYQAAFEAKWQGDGVSIDRSYVHTVVTQAPGNTFPNPFDVGASDHFELRRGGVPQWDDVDYVVRPDSILIIGGFDTGEIFQVRKLSYLRPGASQS